jgi:hypothetical protein
MIAANYHKIIISDFKLGFFDRKDFCRIIADISEIAISSTRKSMVDNNPQIVLVTDVNKIHRDED